MRHAVGGQPALQGEAVLHPGCSLRTDDLKVISGISSMIQISFRYRDDSVPGSAPGSHYAHLALESGIQVRFHNSGDRVAVNIRELGLG